MYGKNSAQGYHFFLRKASLVHCNSLEGLLKWKSIDKKQKNGRFIREKDGNGSWKRTVFG